MKLGNYSVITYNEANKQRIYAFVRGANGNLYVNYWDGSEWQWADQSVPSAMSENFSYTISEVPDLDQRWDALPKNGGMYCVPAAALNWMYYLANHGRPGAITYPPANPSFGPGVLLNLMAMANYMDTDPEDGTSGSGAFDGLVDWMDDHHVPAYITSQGVHAGITSGDIKFLALTSSLMILIRGYYKRNGSEFERVSGHALTLVGFQANGNNMEIIVHDPADDKNLKTQSAPVDKPVLVKEETRNIEGASVKILRWGSSTNPYKFIDGWKAVKPLFALTNPTAEVLTSYSADILTGTITTNEFSLPVNGDLLDLAIHPSKHLASVIARESGDIWTLDLVEGVWNKTATVAAPQFLT